eukprot:scaffold192537_cov14-Tisochrysis_lutea.AAC.1
MVDLRGSTKEFSGCGRSSRKGGVRAERRGRADSGGAPGVLCVLASTQAGSSTPSNKSRWMEQMHGGPGQQSMRAQ